MLTTSDFVCYGFLFILLILDFTISQMKKQIRVLLLLSLTISSFAQNNLISQARGLFDDAQYSAAQAVLNQMSGDNITAEVMYLNAKCSKELFHSDAILLYNELNKVFPYNKFRNEVNKDLAFIYYREKQYADAITLFSKIKSPSNEQLFKLAYSFFSIDSLEDAQFYFSKIMSLDSKFSSPSRYYYACIAYQRGLYKSALENFKQLIDDKKFAVIAPYYISQIYFLKKEYAQLIDFAEPLLSNVISSRRSEINRLLAEAYYRTGDFKNAISYFETFVSEEKESSPIVHFLLGSSYFRSEQYEYAISNFEQVSGAADSIMQYSAYYLGASYLNLGYFNYALKAFKKSAAYNYNKKLKEDAYYNYAKLSYQLELPFNNTIEILSYYLETFDHPLHVKTIKDLIAKTFQATSQYIKAYTVLKDIDMPNYNQRRALQQLSFFLGVNHFNQQNFSEAISYFTNANEHPINDTYFYLSNFWLSDSYFQLGNYTKAIDGYSALPVSVSSNLTIYEGLKKYNLAYAYFQESDYVNAIKWFRSYVKVASDSMKIADSYLRIADGYFMSNNFSLSAKYYKKASIFQLFDVDYALYQNAVSLGLIGKNKSKVKILKQIIKDFPNSSYYDNCLYDLARYYKGILNYALANKYYDELISSSVDDYLVAESYLSKGMIYLNDGQIELAIDEFLLVIRNYKSKEYIKEALVGLKSAYSSIGKIDDYLLLIESLSEINITKAEEDSLIYNTAFMKFLEKDYALATEAFDKYIERFNRGIFIDDALYHNAVSLLMVGDTMGAVRNYEKVIENGGSSYQEQSLVFLARRSYDLLDYGKSNIYYTNLLEFVSSNSMRREIAIRLMRGNEYIDDSIALKYAKQVIGFDKADDWLLSKAYIIIARKEFDSGNYAKSKLLFEKVSVLSNYDEGAEAKYYLAYLTYLDDNLVLAEELIFALAEDYSSDHFIARAFVLLADIYEQLGNLFQAKATLESIIENHDDTSLVNIARKKLEAIIEKERIISVYEEQVFIQISEDDFDYEIDDIYDDYIVPMPDTIREDIDSLGIINKKIKDE